MPNAATHDTLTVLGAAGLGAAIVMTAGGFIVAAATSAIIGEYMVY